MKALPSPRQLQYLIALSETGHFGRLWAEMVTDLGFELHNEPTDWRSPIDLNKLESILKADKDHKIKAVCAVHNETSTGVTSDIAGVRKAMDAAKHPALLFVDTISGLGSIPYEHKAWGVDVTIGGSQKGLMLPPGLSFNVASAKALEANKTAHEIFVYPGAYVVHGTWAAILLMLMRFGPGAIALDRLIARR